MKKIVFLFSALVVLISTSCQEEVKPTANAVVNFDHLWREFDLRYGLFGIKNIDWDAIYARYRPQLDEKATTADLHRVLGQMINELDDNHVTISPTDPSYLHLVSDPHPRRHVPSLQVVKERYLTESKIAPSRNTTPEITYGLLAGNAGYIHISAFFDQMKRYEQNFEDILNYLKDTKGLVIDLRDHTGGSDNAGQLIAGRFANKPYLFMKTRKRNGPAHTDFTHWYEWQVKPTGSWQYAKPVVLLTSDVTVSAAETFILAMKRLPQVKQVGLTTTGALSDLATLEMPNGWQFTLSIGEYLDADGISWESKGIKPEVEIANTPQDIQAGKDKMLEAALGMLP